MWAEPGLCIHGLSGLTLSALSRGAGKPQWWLSVFLSLRGEEEGPYFLLVPLGLVISASRMGRCPGQLLKLLVRGTSESPEEGLLRFICMVLPSTSKPPL